MDKTRWAAYQFTGAGRGWWNRRRFKGSI